MPCNLSCSIDSFLLQNFVPKLQKNILPRIISLLKSKAATEDYDTSEFPDNPDECDPDRMLVFKHNRIYQHRIMHVNYTSYDVRRSQHVVNNHSSHCNIMVLCNSQDTNPSSPPFRYGRIIGTYHVNTMYIGPGRPNYISHRMEFLWIRWYNEVGQAGTSWTHR